MPDDQPRLLWRSIVLGFGFAAGAFMFSTFVAAVVWVALDLSVRVGG